MIKDLCSILVQWHQVGDIGGRKLIVMIKFRSLLCFGPNPALKVRA